MFALAKIFFEKAGHRFSMSKLGISWQTGGEREAYANGEA